MAENSLFAILLRSPWWTSAAIAVLVGAAAWALLPPAWRVVGALTGFPFLVIALIAAWRQRHAPSAARVEQTTQAVRALAWPAFAGLLEQAFQRDGHVVQRRQGAADFVLERRGRAMLVSARRWKSAQTGLEPLRELQAARSAADAPDALYIGLGGLSDAAAAFAAEHRIAVWQAAELAQALRGLALPAAPAR
ncbi:MAG: restriction endonuclease [Piscinibacter sp.]|nr:restriction endonuclease [Piscinibacter sp.]